MGYIIDLLDHTGYTFGRHTFFTAFFTLLFLKRNHHA